MGRQIHAQQCDLVIVARLLTVQNTVKALQRAKISLDGKELAFDATPVATQLFLGNVSR